MHRPPTITPEYCHAAPLRHGFTMIELIAVLVVMAMIMAMASPSLRGWGRGARLRDAAERFQTTALLARSEATAHATTYRLVVDPSGEMYELTNGDDVTQQHVLPINCRIELISIRTAADSVGDGRTLEFRPNGWATPAHVRIVGNWGAAIDLACTSPASTFKRIVEP